MKLLQKCKLNWTKAVLIVLLFIGLLFSLLIKCFVSVRYQRRKGRRSQIMEAFSKGLTRYNMTTKLTTRGSHINGRERWREKEWKDRRNILGLKWKEWKQMKDWKKIELLFIQCPPTPFPLFHQFPISWENRMINFFLNILFCLIYQKTLFLHIFTFYSVW